MSELASFRSVIDLWPSRKALAADIGASYNAVRKWVGREYIPPEYWDSVLSSSIARKEGLSASDFTRLAAQLRDARP